MKLATAGGYPNGLATTGSGSAPVFPGDCVEIFGLTSAGGQALNGCTGIATRKIPESGRFEVRIGVDKRVTVKPENLRLSEGDIGKKVNNLGFAEADRKAECEAAAMFRPGDTVELLGLDDSFKRELNGKSGIVVEDLETPPDRVKVRVDNVLPGTGQFRHVTVRPGNLRKIGPDSLGDAEKAKAALKSGTEPKAQPAADNNDSRLKLDLAVDGDDTAAEVGAPLQAGDIIEVSGLTSQAGAPLNGQKGVVLKCIMADGRAEVRLSAGIKKLKLENLTKMDWDGGDRVTVEVFGLTSESGMAINGSKGVITSKNESTGRFEVKITADKKLSLKPDNLRMFV